MMKLIYLAKAVSYRLYGTFATFLISLIFTHQASIAGAIALTEFVAKVIFYYLHEEIWDRIEKKFFGGGDHE